MLIPGITSMIWGEVFNLFMLQTLFDFLVVWQRLVSLIEQIPDRVWDWAQDKKNVKVPVVG